MWAIARAVLVPLVLVTGTAAAQVDLTGRWRVTYLDHPTGQPVSDLFELVQTGNVLSVVEPSYYHGGTIDPATGVFSLDGPGVCFVAPMRLDAVAAMDGRTFSGTYDESFIASRYCFHITGPVQAERLVETCGNGVVDAGEACDGGACCTEFCTPRKFGWSCPSGGACAADSHCDGAGACIHTPAVAGTVCREGGYCDAAEVCDGTSLACPPNVTPDVDHDGVPDPCDPCVSHPLEDVRIRMGQLGADSSVKVATMRLRLRLDPGVSADPRASALALWVHDAAGRPFLTDGLYGGEFWHQRGAGWTFVNKGQILTGIRSMRIAPVRREPNLWDVRVKMRPTAFPDGAPVPPLSMQLQLDWVPYQNFRCGELTFGVPGAPSPSCSAPSKRGVITCK